MNDPFYSQKTQPHLTDVSEPIPDKVGPYKIETLLHKGGMSWLYLGIDPETKKPLAIKTLPVNHLKDFEATERFCKEARMISLADHPNIVKLYSEGKWDGGLYIAMEWIQGISLRQFLIKQSFSLKRSLEIILQVAFALEHLHAHDVIHRDLKPENILIAESGSIKVIDFGIAQLSTDYSAPTSKKTLGTPHYMSPEQKEDPSSATFTSDIYSLGVIAYELITGKPSYEDIELSLLPKQLRKIIHKMLAISSSERYQTVSSVIQDLSAYLASDEMEQEKPEHDRIKELLETFQIAAQALSPFPAPPWAFAEIGIAKTLSTSQFGLYYDLFKISQDHYFLLIVTPLKQDLDPLFEVANLRGYIRSTIASLSDPEKAPFSPLTFLQTLTHTVQNDPLIKKFAFSYLYLDASADQLTFFNAGLSHLIHIPENSTPRVLHNRHSLLTEASLSEFSETIDNWNPGDTIIFHSLIPEINLLPEKASLMEKTFTETVESALLLSPKAQAETILKGCQSHSSLSNPSQMQVIISIQRTT